MMIFKDFCSTGLGCEEDGMYITVSVIQCSISEKKDGGGGVAVSQRDQYM